MELVSRKYAEKKAEEEIIQDPKKYEFKRIDARNGYQTASRKRYRPTHCMTRPNRRTTNLLDLTPTQKRRHPPRVAKKEYTVGFDTIITLKPPQNKLPCAFSSTNTKYL